MAQLPTGGGKTIVFSAIASEFIKRGENVLILAHREELITQAADKLEVITGSPVGIIKAGYKPNPLFPVQVASVQSMVNRLNHFENFDLIIIDECHHATAKTYRDILGAFPNAYQLGVTATPIRTDKTGFDDLFDALVTGPTVAELIKLGHLSSFRLFADANPMTTKGCRTVAGDYSANAIAKANDVIELSGNLVNSYREYANGKQCVVFAVNVEHSTAIAERYNQVGIPAHHLDGKTPAEERRVTLERFKQGEIKVISNCQLFDEGLDIPALEAVQIAKPTKSLSRWLQMVGRSLRVSDGKEYAVIIDHTQNWAIHGLPTRKRIWTLQGVQEVSESKKKRTERNPETGEVITVEIIEQEQVLTEIESNPIDEWQGTYEQLLVTCQAFGHNIGWVYYKLVELKPPLHIWEQYAQLRGYKKGWAKYRFEELGGELSEPQNQQSLEDIWQEVLLQISALVQAMLRAHGNLLRLDENIAQVGIKNEPLLKIANTRREVIEAAFTQVCGRQIKVQLIVGNVKNS